MRIALICLFLTFTSLVTASMLTSMEIDHLNKMDDMILAEVDMLLAEKEAEYSEIDKFQNLVEEILFTLKALDLPHSSTLSLAYSKVHNLKTKTLFSCKEIIQSIEEVTEMITNSLISEFPSLKENIVFDSLVSSLHSLLSLVSQSSFCVLVNQEESQCLNKEQQMDVDEIVQLLGNVLNTFSEWLIEAEEKAQSSELKLVLKKLSQLLQKEKELLEKYGSEVVEKSCEVCAVGVKVLSKFVKFEEKLLKTFVPLWKYIPFLETLLNKVDEVMLKAQSLCPDNNIVLYMEEFDLKVKLLLVRNGVKDLFSSSAFLDFDNEIELTCSEVVEKVEKYVSELEEFLTKMIPNWQELPFVSQLDNLVHSLLDKIHSKCPSSSSISLLSFGKQGCLTEEQKEKMDNITFHLKVGLDVVANVIDLRAQFEPNPVKKYTLMEMSKVVRVVGGEIVMNLTKLADESCGECSDLLQAARDSVVVLEQALFDVEPLWKKTPLYDGILKVTDTLFDSLSKLCKQQSKEVSSLKRDDCLSPSEKDTLEAYIKSFDGLLSYAADTMETYAEDVPDEVVKEELMGAVKVLRAVDEDLVKTFSHIAEETCGTCLDVTKGLKDMEESVEKAMGDIDPNWRENPNYSAVASLMTAVITLLQKLCPTTLQSGCEGLSEEERRAVEFSSSVLMLTSKDSSLCEKREQVLSEVMKHAQGVDFKLQHNEQFEFIALSLRASIKAFVQRMEVMEAKTAEEEGLKLVMTVTLNLMHDRIGEKVMKLEQDSETDFSCGKFVETVSEVVDEAENLLKEIVPGFADFGPVKAVFTFINSLLKELHDLCPNELLGKRNFVDEVKTVEV